MVEALLINLFAQAVWDLALSPILGTSGLPWNTSEDEPEIREARFGEAARLAVERLSALPGLEIEDDRLAELLSCPEVLVLLRSLYLFRLDETTDDFQQAREEFVVLWGRSSISRTNASANDVFDVLLSATEDTLTAAIHDGVLSAHEARSSARHQMLAQQIDAIERRTQLLVGAGSINRDEINQFEADLRREVHLRHAYITPPDFYGASRRVDIDRLYVMPELTKVGRDPNDHTETITVTEWLKNLRQSVVLGDPGGGKSTLAARLCHGVADSANHWQVAGMQLTPVMVTLREYSSSNKDRTISVSRYIEEIAESRYQLKVPTGAIEYLLLSGRLMVIFDGLDELLETHHRQQIRDDVESFHRRYPEAPILVTSRSVGYEQAPLNEDVFRTVTLAEFSDEQVSEYAHKWFGFDESLTAEERTRKATAFIAESTAVPDLRTNPLMLALMCNFYRGQNYLPRHLPEVYETCARMLFETWDRSRGIEQVLPIAEHIRPAMRYLAHWIYQDETLQGGATESDLVNKAVEFLLEYRFDDEHEARHAAEAFIEFCAGRAWVFTDTGSTAGGEPLFQFTHRTFLEYFAADHIVAVNDTTQALSESLRPRIAAREWSVVAQVAYQLKSRSTLAASDQLLIDLVEHSYKDDLSAQANLLLFAVECLKFLVPSPPVVRAVSERVLEFVLASMSRDITNEVASVIDSLMPTLVRVGHEIRKTVTATIEEVLIPRINEREEEAVSAALCLIAVGRGTMPFSDVVEDWQQVVERLESETLESRRMLATENSELALALATDRDITINDLVEHHGTNCLFVGRPVPLRRNAFFGPLADNSVFLALQDADKGSRSRWCELLMEIGDVLCNQPTPWRKLSSGMLWGIGDFFMRADEIPEDTFPSEALFGLAIVLAVKMEEQLITHEDGENGAVKVRSQLETVKSAPLKEIAPILLGRLGDIDSAEVWLQKSQFNEKQGAWLLQWLRDEVAFVEAGPA